MCSRAVCAATRENLVYEQAERLKRDDVLRLAQKKKMVLDPFQWLLLYPNYTRPMAIRHFPPFPNQV